MFLDDVTSATFGVGIAPFTLFVGSDALTVVPVFGWFLLGQFLKCHFLYIGTGSEISVGKLIRHSFYTIKCFQVRAGTRTTGHLLALHLASTNRVLGNMDSRANTTMAHHKVPHRANTTMAHHRAHHRVSTTTDHHRGLLPASMAHHKAEDRARANVATSTGAKCTNHRLSCKISAKTVV